MTGRVGHKLHPHFAAIAPGDAGQKCATVIIVEQPETLGQGGDFDGPQLGAMGRDIAELAFDDKPPVEAHDLARAQPCALSFFPATFMGWLNPRHIKILPAVPHRIGLKIGKDFQKARCAVLRAQFSRFRLPMRYFLSREPSGMVTLNRFVSV
jgi:hypothetical protein